jgi:small subunit ribosomal protein S18
MPTKQRKEKIKPRSKECAFCKAKVEPVWSDVERLGEYLSARGRILSSQFTGVCVKHQKVLAREIKHARHLALLPFTSQE